jgi:hypothetical protein
MATSSWVFKDMFKERDPAKPALKTLKIAWVTKDRSRFSQYTRDALNLMAYMAVARLSKNNAELKKELAKMAGEKPEQIAARYAYLSQDANFVQPITYTQFVNSLRGENITTPHGKFGLRLPFRQVVVIIDEIHEFMEYLDDPSHPKATWEKFKEVIDQARDPTQVPPEEMLRIIGLTATPTYKSPVTLFKILYAVGAQWQLDRLVATGRYQIGTKYQKLPLNEADLQGWLETKRVVNGVAVEGSGAMSASALNTLRFCCDGLVSYLSVLNDPGRFPQVVNDIWIKLRISDMQYQRIKQGVMPSGVDYKYYYARPRGRPKGTGYRQRAAAAAQGLSEAPVQRAAVKRYDAMFEGELARPADENFAVYATEYMADSPGFKGRVTKILQDEQYLSPKFQVLLTRIAQLDSANPGGKHLVYTGSWFSCKQIWSLLVANGYRHPYTESGIIGEFGDNTVAVLSTDPEARLFGKMLYQSNPLLDTTFSQTKAAFNDKKNAHGNSIKILIIDHTVQASHDFLDVKFLHLMEPTSSSSMMLDMLRDDDAATKLGISAVRRDALRQELIKLISQKKAEIINESGSAYRVRTRNRKDARVGEVAFYEIKQDFDTVEKQITGRITRLCGHKNLVFTELGWTFDITRYYALLPLQRGAVKNDTTVYEEILRSGKMGTVGTKLSNLFANLQLHNMLLDVTIDRGMPPEIGTSVSRPHHQLGYPVQQEFML